MTASGLGAGGKVGEGDIYSKLTVFTVVLGSTFDLAAGTAYQKDTKEGTRVGPHLQWRWGFSGTWRWELKPAQIIAAARAALPRVDRGMDPSPEPGMSNSCLG